MLKFTLEASIATDRYVLKPVRHFAWGYVAAARSKKGSVLIFEEKEASAWTVYEYEDRDEYEADLQRVVNYPGGAEENGAGVPAPVHPPQPVLTARAPLPIL